MKMTGKTVPRYLALTAALTIIVGTLTLSEFYSEFLVLKDELVETSATSFDDRLLVAFELRAGDRLERIAESIEIHGPNGMTGVDPVNILRAAMNGSVDLTGLAYLPGDGSRVTVGDSEGLPDADSDLGEVLGGNDSIILRQAIEYPSGSPGVLYGKFSLASVQRQTEEFRDMLDAAEAEQRTSSLLRFVAVIAASAVLCGLVIWVVSRRQSRRIDALRAEALKLSQADFGEPLVVDRDDELGQLARAFNEMREDLQKTTVSRDYVDKLLSGMNESILVTDMDGRITRSNEAAQHMLGYSADDLLGRPIAELVASGSGLKTASDVSVPHDAVLLNRDGVEVPVSYTGSIVEPDVGIPGAQIFAAQNMTERRKAEMRIRYLARIDPLTKVPNRMQFQHLLQRAIARAKRNDYSIALFYIDIDHFKEINDTFGHMAGDTALETVASRLSDVLPDDCVVGRLAGDEFAVIIDNVDRSAEARDYIGKLARQALDRLAEPLYVQGHEVFIAASLGIACYPEDGTNVIDLIRNGDAALYHSKHNGGNAYTYYTPELNQPNVERLMTRSKLKRAFERDELLVRYQPRYEVETGKVVGAEALVRWQLPDRGIILPNDFIPLAEENELIIQIGEWVLDRVCADYRYWSRSVSNAGRISVNLSLRQLRQPNFISRIAAILRTYEMSPTSLELEITETTLMENPVRTVKILDQLYAQGLHLAIDDFGTGYSSLSALQQFPISTLKVDRSFVRDVATNQDDATIVGTILQMGNSLNMDVVAEGVETEEQLNFLQTLGCAYVQGLLFGDPMSSDDYLDLVLAQAEGTDRYRALFA